MTATEPQRLADAIDAAIRDWPATTGQTPPSSLFCAEPHPIDQAVLCRRLNGHPGEHHADGADAWETCVPSCPICTEPPTLPDAWDGRWPAARWSPDAPAGVTDTEETR